MDWIERLNKAMNYIEEHLTDEIDYGQLGRIACCSAYHFQRMSKIVDVAGNYGYQSPTAFNRAFQAIHGVAPSALKNGSVPVKSFPPISFKITIKGAEEMNYRIETKEAFRIVGVSVPLEKEIEKNFAMIPAKWNEVLADGTLKKLAGRMDGEPMGVLGVSTCSDEEPWRYYIAVSSAKEQGEFEEYTVPASTWAIFSGSGAG